MLIRIALHTLAGLLILNLSSASTFAQTQDDLEQFAASASQYMKLRVAGRVAEAARAAEETRDIVRRRFPKRDQFKGTLLLAEARGYEGRYREAVELWQQTLEQLKDFTPQNETERQMAVLCYGDSLRTIGVCLERLGRTADTIPYHEAAIRFWSQVQHPEAQSHLARAKTSFADTHRLLGDLDKAAQLSAEATAILEPLARAETSIGSATRNLCDAIHIGGHVAMQQDRYDLAETRFRRALRLRVAENGMHHLDTAVILDSFVQLYAVQGRWQEAEMYCRAELAAYDLSVGKDHVEVTKVQLRMAQLLNHQDRSAEAEPLARQAVAKLAAELGTDNPRTTLANQELVKTLWLQEKYSEAEPILKNSLDFEIKIYGPESARLADSLLQYAHLKIFQDDHAETLRILDRLTAIHQLSPLPSQKVQNLLGTRAVALWLSGQQAEAVTALDLCLEQTELLRTFASGAERERAEMFLGTNASYATAVKWQAELKDVAKLFTMIERAKARSFLDELKLKNIDLLAGLSDAVRDELKHNENQLRQAVMAAENRLNELPAPGPKPSAELITQHKNLAGEVLAARDELYQYLTDLRSASPVYRELIGQKSNAATIPQVQQLMGDDELHLTYYIDKFESYVVAVRKTSAEFAPLVIDETTAAQLGVAAGPLTVGVLNQILQDKQTGLLTIMSSHKRHDEDQSKRLSLLWKLLIPQAEQDALISGKLKLLTIIPDGPLALLPFETLVVNDDIDNPEYLLDVGPPIAYAPSASVLLNLAGRAPSDAAAAQKLLTLGDPNYAPASTTTDAVDRQLGLSRSIDRFRAGLTRLPYTGKESNWVQQNFEKIGFTTVKVTGPAATEAAIRQHAPGRQIIHLACHGMADQNYGNFFGALAIAPGRAGDPRDDGYLSMSEIYELNLDGCELAILSACETNYGPQQQGEGVWALSRGFLVAGSRRVVASNWVVDDAAGATLVSYFAGYLTLAGKDPTARNYASALHNAKKQVRKQEQWKHPFFWSSLVLVGPK
ncbi:CHAT domain protein [Anatilimnocola aggregata]|uniref:CHAT domain protein n=1 Tax=Anatilimnocola aggregata TaxID=2528021 RepID=A0A517YH00_9BACT|nr:CHAT domain-containing protein [Anatilimnocola aggregata]QDU29514.1 CHAT domain protein [Anatilimnocola aggregata]